jgi:transposase
MSRFIPVDRYTDYLLPPSVDDWLPENHLARFIVEVVDQLDLTKRTRKYTGRGSAAHHPSVLLGLLVYGYATGVFSSRKIERASYDSVAFRFIAANTHPDHDTLAHFRKTHLAELEDLFVQVLQLAQAMKLVKLGQIALDGTKVKANASKHKALSHGHIEKLETQLRAEVQTLLAKAETADCECLAEGVDLPQEIVRREERLAALAKAKAKIQARAEERLQQEQQAYEAKAARREAQRQAGQKPRGKEPKPPEPGPKDQDQVNLTDEESRIMPVSGGFEQAYNAQAAVDTDTMLIIATGMTQRPNDKQQVEPMLDKLQALPESLGTIYSLIADNGFFSAANVKACADRHIEPLMPLEERLRADAPLPETADPVVKMAAKLKAQQGRKRYGQRKCTVEPVFGIIKQVMGFRQFLLRGLEAVTGEWQLVTMAFNLKRMHVLSGV